MGQWRLGLNLQAATATAINFPGVAGDLAADEEAALTALVDDVGAGASALVAEAVGLKGAFYLPPIAQLSRAEWLTVAVAGMGRLFSPILESVSRPTDSRVTRAMLSLELGGALGYMSKRVLGHYDWPLVPTDGGPPAIYILGQNVLAFSSRHGLRTDELLLWLLAHELTHSAQFSKAAWLGEYLRDLVDEQLQVFSDLLSDSAGGSAGNLLLGLLTDGLVLAKTQALMAVIEGHADFVMSRIGKQVTPQAMGLATLMERHDARRSLLQRFLDRVLGLELKLSQYRLGKGFFAAVYREGGPDAVAKVWEGPAFLPDLEELAEPRRWLWRVC